ncbi:MAG: transposase [Candidatus Riflebacteria bacterium]|nr:transposase [Candidatus Riflebacteria bacterium]
MSFYAFNYDEKTDCFYCSMGQALTSYAKNLKSSSHRVRQYVGKKEVCQNCRKKERCLSKCGQRIIIQVPAGDTKDYIGMMIEPVFGNIKVQKGLWRFSLHGKMKTNIQWLLGCMVHNLEKIGTKGFKQKKEERCQPVKKYFRL